MRIMAERERNKTGKGIRIMAERERNNKRKEV